MVPQGTDQNFPGTNSRAGTRETRIKNPAKPLPKLISNKMENECKKKPLKNNSFQNKNVAIRMIIKVEGKA